MREQDTEPFTSALAMTDALSFTLRSASYRASVQREPRCPANAAKDHTNAGAADRVIVERSMLTKDAADAKLLMAAQAVHMAQAGKTALLLLSKDAIFRQCQRELQTATPRCSCFLVSEHSFEQVRVVVEGVCGGQLKDGEWTEVAKHKRKKRTEAKKKKKRAAKVAPAQPPSSAGAVGTAPTTNAAGRASSAPPYAALMGLLKEHPGATLKVDGLKDANSGYTCAISLLCPALADQGAPRMFEAQGNGASKKKAQDQAARVILDAMAAAESGGAGENDDEYFSATEDP